MMSLPNNDDMPAGATLPGLLKTAEKAWHHSSEQTTMQQDPFTALHRYNEHHPECSMTPGLVDDEYAAFEEEASRSKEQDMRKRTTLPSAVITTEGSFLEPDAGSDFAALLAHLYQAPDSRPAVLGRQDNIHSIAAATAMAPPPLDQRRGQMSSAGVYKHLVPPSRYQPGQHTLKPFARPPGYARAASHDHCGSPATIHQPLVPGAPYARPFSIQPPSTAVPFPRGYPRAVVAGPSTLQHIHIPQVTGQSMMPQNAAYQVPVPYSNQNPAWHKSAVSISKRPQEPGLQAPPTKRARMDAATTSQSLSTSIAVPQLSMAIVDTPAPSRQPWTNAQQYPYVDSLSQQLPAPQFVHLGQPLQPAATEQMPTPRARPPALHLDFGENRGQGWNPGTTQTKHPASLPSSMATWHKR